jgi:D-sedoheptulose 7-phosphate isomerase
MSALDAQLTQLRASLDELDGLQAQLDAAAAAIAASLRVGGKLLIAGNGGSAAEAQHLSSELVGRLHPDRERGALAAVALHADTSALTAVANDYGYDQVFARQVQALGRAGDVLLVMSTSGASANLVNAVDAADELGITTVGFLGSTRRVLHERCAHVLAAPAADTQTIQVCHLILVHVLVELIEDALEASDTQ